jgi:hypothetical protein
VSAARGRQTGFGYTIAIYFISFLVSAMLWGLLNIVHDKIFRQAQTFATSPTAQRGLGWAGTAWDFALLILTFVFVTFIISRAVAIAGGPR